MKNKINKIVSFLKNLKDPAIAFSGGKDSLAALIISILESKIKPKTIIYCEITGNTDEKCTKYVYQIINELNLKDVFYHLKINKDFFDALVKYGIPLPSNRWCMRMYKLEPTGKLVTNLKIKYVITGVTSYSKFRKSRQLIELFRYWNFYWVNPLIEFTKEEIYKIIEEYGFKPNPCYSIYGHSGNCMFCYGHTKELILRTLQDPYWRNKIIKALENVKCRTIYCENIRKRWLELAKNSST